VTLKMEKVYQPCILQTKKRYVGFAYETADQTEPVFDAKGIETIRWGCTASRVACTTAGATAAAITHLGTVQQQHRACRPQQHAHGACRC
jgi:hypothetical protein